MTWNTDRTVGEVFDRQRGEDARRATDEERQRADGRRGCPAPEPSRLGVPAGLDVEEQIEWLRTWLSTRVKDADLLVASAIEDENQREMAERVGLTHEVVRKRLQRARDRTREVLSRFDEKDRVSSSTASIRRRARCSSRARR